jgi:pyrroloquinoline quinone biosynthesis protein D
VLVPNPTATAILQLCDGEADVDAITLALSNQYDGVQPEQVVEVLIRLADRQVVEWS